MITETIINEVARKVEAVTGFSLKRLGVKAGTVRSFGPGLFSHTN